MEFSWKNLENGKITKKTVKMKEMLVAICQNSASISATGMLIVVTFYVLPFTMGVDIVGYKAKINRSECKCNCFDRVMKGPYKDLHGYQYKSVFINYDKETTYMFIITVIYIHIVYQFIRQIFSLVTKRKLNKSVLLVSALNYYQLNYNWFSLWNYINERFYRLFPTQMFFVITEILPFSALFHLLDNQIVVSETFLKLSNIISCAHLLLALEDQGLAHIFNLSYLKDNAGSMAFWKYRDLMFAVGDLSMIVLFSRMLSMNRFGLESKSQIKRLLHSLIVQHVLGVIIFKLIYGGLKWTYGYI